MAGRHLKALIAAYRDKDDLAFRRAAQAIIEEAEGKRHVALARDLRRLLATGTSLSMPADNAPLPESPRDRDTDLPLTDASISHRLLDDLVLPTGLSERLHELVCEVNSWSQLDAAG